MSNNEIKIDKLIINQKTTEDKISWEYLNSFGIYKGVHDDKKILELKNKIKELSEQQSFPQVLLD
jgi:hypothetical protein